jgi:hypothetical protein
MKRSTNLLPTPGDFALGSAESRAAARIQLAQLLDNRDWVTLYCESDGDQMNFGPWTKSPDGQLVLRQVLLPTVWETLPIKVIPSCSACGVPFTEHGRFKTTVCFHPACTDRHDPAPPPKNRSQRNSGFFISEFELSQVRQALVKIRCFELEAQLMC